MRNWFFTTAYIVIASLSTSLFISIIMFYLLVKSSIKAILLKFYPEAKYYKKSSSKIRKSFSIDSAFENTDDPVSSGESSSDTDSQPSSSKFWHKAVDEE